MIESTGPFNPANPATALSASVGHVLVSDTIAPPCAAAGAEEEEEATPALDESGGAQAAGLSAHSSKADVASKLET